MTEQYYSVDVTIETPATMIIKAVDAANAKEIAQELLDEGRGQFETDPASGTATVERATEEPSLDERGMAIAEHNRVDYLELCDELDEGTTS